MIEERSDPSGRPILFDPTPAAGAAAHTLSPAARGSSKRVAEVLETWRIDDEWWRAPISRRYVEVALEGGGHIVVFEDLTTGNWFLQMP